MVEKMQEEHVNDIGEQHGTLSVIADEPQAKATENGRAERRGAPGIRWKVFAYLLGFCLLLLIILTLFQTVFLERFYISIKRNQVQGEIANITKYVQAEDWQGLSGAVDESGELYAQIWLIDGNVGTLVISSGSFLDGIHTQLRMEDLVDIILQLQESGGAITNQYESKYNGSNQQNLVSAQLVEGNSGYTYLTMVSAGLSPVDATVDTLRQQLVYISVIMLILSVVLALLIARNISRPITSISESAGELGQGNYDVVFEGSGYQEAVQLAAVLTEAATELGKTEQLRQELIANVSHDLRTPLTLITGYSEMMQDMPEEVTAENLQVIIDESNRLTSLVNDLLDLSKLQSGTEQLQLERLDLGELAVEIAQRVSSFYIGRGFEIECSAPEVYVLGDRARLEQVIYNFLLNAVEHSEDSRLVELRVEATGGRARLEVEDHGTGIDEAELPHIWDRYYKVNKEHKRAASGSGLGLSIVRSILERHPGVEYGVRSELGAGSVFWFSIEIWQD